MKKHIFFIVGFVCMVISLQAQSSLEIKPLTIGERIPDVGFHNMINYKTTSARLSDFRGKPVILDFFATWCGSCIEELPKLDSLQRLFKDSIQILVVDDEPTAKVAAFLKRNPVGRKSLLPFITKDSLLSELFPHRLIPHEVWIDKNSRVAAITLPDYVLAKNIRPLIIGRSIHLPLKKDFIQFSLDKPLLDNDNGGTINNIMFRSTFSGYLEGIGGKEAILKDSIHIKILEINVPVLALYNMAADSFGNRLILKVKDTGRYIYNGLQPFSTWGPQNCYCYELIAPADLSFGLLHKMMLDDLNQYLSLNGYYAKHTVTCWALINTASGTSLFQSRGGRPVIDYGSGFDIQVFHNQPISQFVEALNNQIPGRPIVPIILNETGYTGNVDLELKGNNIHDISALRKSLQPYGLDLVQVKRELKMFVLSDKIQGSSTGFITNQP